jgi:mannose-6-phosphate isomerase
LRLAHPTPPRADGLRDDRVRPIVLGPNPVPKFYRGGSALAGFRGIASTAERSPEDWVGSATTAFGTADEGLSLLDDGTPLREAFAADPNAFFGPRHAERLGADPGLLVKLLDAGERLPVHCHPDRRFSRDHLNCPYGKTEAWVVIGTEGARPSVYLGFREHVSRQTLDEWVYAQDRAGLLAAVNRLPVAVGDTLLVPGGVPHAIGEAVFVVEPQEPADLSVLLEWEGFDIDGRREGHVGLGFDVALGCVDRTAWDSSRLERLRRVRRRDRPGVDVLFPQEADLFFRAERIRPQPISMLPASFSILVTVEGEGKLETGLGERMILERGQTVLVPFAAGDCTLEGRLSAIRCMPPEVGQLNTG